MTAFVQYAGSPSLYAERFDSIKRMWRELLAGILFAAAASGEQTHERIQFAPPAFLTGPVVAHSMLGVTYAYHKADLSANTGLEISIVTLPAAIKPADVSAEHCIALFMTEVAKNHRDFFAIQTDARLEAGPLELTQVRWTARDSKQGITGVTSCAVDKGRYISINFHDSIGAASASFPEIRASIRNLEFRD